MNPHNHFERTLRVVNVKHIAVSLEHVHLLDTCNRLHGKLLHCSLQLRVVTTGNCTLWFFHNLAARRTFTACADGALHLSQLFLVNGHVKLS